MNTEDFGKIESALSMKLPKEYKDLMKIFPFADFKFQNIEDDLWNNPDIIINKNRELRQDGFFEQKWNDKWFAFGHDGMDNISYMDTSRNIATIFLADHEGLINEIETKSFQDWIESKKTDYRKWQEEDEKRKLKFKNKKWWQIWIR